MLLRRRSRPTLLLRFTTLARFVVGIGHARKNLPCLAQPAPNALPTGGKVVAGQATVDLISGQLQLMFQLVPGIAQHARSGAVRAITVLAPKRLAGLPNVPTSAEAGMPGLESSAWFGILVPTGTSRPIVMRLNREINAALKDAGLIKRYSDLGVEALGGTPEEFARYLDDETRKWGEVVRFSGAKID